MSIVSTDSMAFFLAKYTLSVFTGKYRKNSPSITSQERGPDDSYRRISSIEHLKMLQRLSIVVVLMGWS